MGSLVFGGEAPKNPALAAQAKGGQSGELGDIRADVESAMQRLEARDYGQPEIDWIDGGAAAAAGGDIIIKGRNLLQGRDAASLTLFTGTSELVFTALKPGKAGNDYTVEIQNTGSLTVTLTGTALVITINLGTTDADAIATAVNADGADTDGIITCNGGGAGVAQAVTAATALTGGTGDGFECLISGVECLPANTTGANGGETITDTQLTVTVPDLTALGDARAAGDIVQLTVKTDDVLAQPLTMALA